MESSAAMGRQVSYELIHLALSATWEDSICPLCLVASRPENCNIPNLMGSYAASLSPVYLLVTVRDGIKLLHGLRHCYEVPGGGARVLGLMGERAKHGDVVIEPALYTLGGNIANQQAHFSWVSILALALEDLAAAYAADEDLDVVAPDGAANAAEVVTWKALEVLEKFAWAFAGGLSFRKAVALMPRLLVATPAEFCDKLGPLIDFVWVSATAGANGVSAASTSWEVMETRANGPLHLWYLQLLQQRAPRFTEVPMLAPAPAPALDPAMFVNAVKVAASTRGLDTPSKKEYDDYKRARIFKVVGQTANADGSYDGLTHDQVPELFKRLLACKSAGKARVLLEEWYKANRPTDAPAYTIVLSANFISCMQNLTFYGDDELIMHAKHQVGFSPFALAPVSMADLEAASNRRATYLQFKRTEENHTPAHAAQMDELTHGPVQYPNTLEAFEKWLVCFIGTVGAFLMVTCDLLIPLQKLWEKLYNPTLFSGYVARDYQGLAWMTHRAIRKFFKEGNTDMLRRIIADVEAERKHGEDCLPPEMRAPPPAYVSDTSSNRSGMSSMSGDSGAGRDSKRQCTNTSSGAPFAAVFVKDLTRAERALKERVSGQQLCPDGPAIKKLFGDEFLRLLPPRASPCLKFFVFGNCNSFSGPCPHCHDLARPIPQPVLDGLQKCVKDRCDDIVWNPKNS